MTEYPVHRLLAAIGADASLIPPALLNRVPAGVSTDTRAIRPGDVFFGIRGERFDGAAFTGAALDAGAVLAVVNGDAASGLPPGAPVVRVSDTVRALGDAARDYRSAFSGTVLAVTGTNGKTTVKEMVRSVLGTRFRVHATSGNLNNHIGLPLSVLGLNGLHDCAVFEMGMSAPGEIEYLANIARPEIGVMLNVGPGHMEFFPDLDAVADAKTELLRALSPEGTAIMNADDPLLRARESGGRCRIVRFGVEAPCDFRAEGIETGPDGCASFRAEGTSVRLRVPGVHSVYNALAAWASGRVMGLEKTEIAGALEAFEAPKMRMQTIEREGIRYINDSYNANPLSMRAAADMLATLRIPVGGRLIVALGDMRELGTVSVSAHRETGRRFGALGPALLVLVGEQAENYRAGAIETGLDAARIHTFGNAAEALPMINDLKRPGDVVFAKGSRALGMERFIAESNGKA